MTHPRMASTFCVWLAVALSAAAAVTEDLPFEEEAAIRAAVVRVAPAVVRIETAGVSAAALAASLEANPASGPSTGVVVEAEGWVLATSFAVPADAKEAIVVLPGDAAGNRGGSTRRVGRVVGRDLARGLVLLRINDTGLPTVAGWVPRAELAVGQWAIAVGRAWNADVPSVSVGILSATNRSWGRSVQTDASISPANYGGPLIDISGRVIGILAPLPADTAGMNLGTELYDSGIGFAVPMEDVARVLPRLKNGETLSPGVLGIGYAARDPFTAAAVIASVRPASPAALAGLRPGDSIVAADGRPVTRISELRHVLAPHYAGDSVTLAVERAVAGKGPRASASKDEKLDLPEPEPVPPARIEVKVVLAESLPPWRRPWLGIVPVRATGRDGQPTPVQVSWVWPGSPAALAGIVAGDRIEAVEPPVAAGDTAASGDAVPIDSAAVLAGFVSGIDIGQSLGLVISREGKRQSIAVTAAAMPDSVPADVPAFVPTRQGPVAVAGDAAVVERLEAAEIAKPPLAVLPTVSPQEPLGVLVYLDVPRGDVAEAQAAAWKAAAVQHGVAVILPGSADPQRWSREDIGSIKRALATLAGKRALDPARIAVAGRGAGGAFAWLVAEAIGPAVRGVALIDASLPRQAAIETAEPGRSRWVLFGSSAEQASTRAQADRRRLEAAGFSVGTLPVAGDGVPAVALTAWVESLGVL